MAMVDVRIEGSLKSKKRSLVRYFFGGSVTGKKNKIRVNLIYRVISKPECFFSLQLYTQELIDKLIRPKLFSFVNIKIMQ